MSPPLCFFPLPSEELLCGAWCPALTAHYAGQRVGILLWGLRAAFQHPSQDSTQTLLLLVCHVGHVNNCQWWILTGEDNSISPSNYTGPSPRFIFTNTLYVVQPGSAQNHITFSLSKIKKYVRWLKGALGFWLYAAQKIEISLFLPKAAPPTVEYQVDMLIWQMCWWTVAYLHI